MGASYNALYVRIIKNHGASSIHAPSLHFSLVLYPLEDSLLIACEPVSVAHVHICHFEGGTDQRNKLLVIGHFLGNPAS